MRVMVARSVLERGRGACETTRSAERDHASASRTARLARKDRAPFRHPPSLRPPPVAVGTARARSLARPQSMSDRAAFRDNLNLALDQLRLLPEMASTPGGDDRRAAALAAADKAAASSGAPPGSDMSAMFACLGVGTQTGSSDERPAGSFRIPVGAGGERNELRSLVFGLLEIDPDKRLTLKGACGHPWFAPAAAFIDKA